MYGSIPFVEDSSNDESPGDSSEGFNLTLAEASTGPLHTVDGTCKTDGNNAIFFQEPLLAPVEDHDLSDSSDREAHDVLSICESDSQVENEMSQLADEAYADEEWESYSSDDNEDDQDCHQDILANEIEPGSLSQGDSSMSGDGDQPLYVGAPITLGASTLLIITFAMTHSLSGEALSHLLDLIDAHCITPNLCTTAINKF